MRITSSKGEQFDLNKNDQIIHDGQCYKITTRQQKIGWKIYTPILANNIAQQLIKDGKLKFAFKDCYNGHNVYIIRD